MKAFSSRKTLSSSLQNNVRKEPYLKFKTASKKLFGLISLGTLSMEELKRIIKCALKSGFITKEIEDDLKAFKDSL